jgi:hypothetical protein
MPQALDGCWAKVHRADECLASLKTEVAEFLSSDPRPFRIVGDHHNNFTEYGYTVHAPEIPLRFSVLVGEVVHHLRSTLDHLVWALALRTTNGPSSRIQFPICDTREKFDKAIKNGVLRGVGSSAIKLIESLQPFKSKTPHDTFFYALHQLDIEDKHRLLVVVGAAATMKPEVVLAGVEGNFPDRGTPVSIVALDLQDRVCVNRDGTRIFTVRFADPSPSMKAIAEFDISLAFEQLGKTKAVPIVASLEQLRQSVVNALNSFSHLFCCSPRGLH